MGADRSTGIVGAIREAIRAHARKSAAERIDAAVQDKARAHSDSVYHFEMATYYQEAAAAIDPNVDWWGFASVRQKLEDSRTMHQHQTQRYSEASARLGALIASTNTHPRRIER